MNNIIFSRSGDLDKASTFAGGIGGSLIAVSSTACFNQNTTLSNAESCSTACEVVKLEIVDACSDVESNTTSNFPEIEAVFSYTGRMIDPLNYVISWAGNEYSTLYKFACEVNQMLYSSINVWIIEEDGTPRFLPKS